MSAATFSSIESPSLVAQDHKRSKMISALSRQGLNLSSKGDTFKSTRIADCAPSIFSKTSLIIRTEGSLAHSSRISTLSLNSLSISPFSWRPKARTCQVRNLKGEKTVQNLPCRLHGLGSSPVGHLSGPYFLKTVR